MVIQSASVRAEVGITLAANRLNRVLSAWVVGQGLALAYRRYSLDYVDHEADARAARRGIWRTTFERPWEWRRQQQKR
ncbi:MAG: hypothetical protein IH878_14415 [Gemmatimonadetes bacterium]|nr:hypothetical protein [Gemmatimonadota bacterium]